MVAINPTLLKKIRRIQIKTTQLANDLLAGAYRSAFKGKGMEFEEVREYQSGDEIRTIDWNVTARMGKPFVKNFREEREISVMLMIDVSASSRFGSHQLTKGDLIAEIGAVIALSAIKNQDKIGLILFSDSIELYLPPQKGSRHVLRLIRELLAFEPKNTGTDINAALNFMGSIQKKMGVCFLISDFLSSDYSKQAALIAKSQDLIAIQIYDPKEHSIPSMGLTEFQDLESGQSILVDTSNENTQKTFLDLVSQRDLQHEKLMAKIGAGHIKINTQESYIKPIQKFFKQRSKKRR
jgi:uncharacterized protein (DUF58 family)